MPWWPPSSVVLTAVTMKSARTPLVMNVFEPLTTQPPSTFLAFVRMPATSEPGVRLGDRERGDLLAGDGGHEVALLLVFGAELEDRRRRDADVRTDAGRQAAGTGSARAPR